MAGDAAAVVGRCGWCDLPVLERDALWLTVDQGTSASTDVLWHKAAEDCGQRPALGRPMRLPR